MLSFKLFKIYPMIAKLQDTGSELMLPDIKYFQEFGGEKIIFEKEETSKIKKIVDQGNS